MRKPRILPLLGLAIVAVVGFGLGLVFWNNPEPKKVPKVVSEAEPVFVGLEKEIPKSFTDYEVERMGWSGQNTTGNPIEVPGFEFRISDEALPGLLIHPRRVNDELITPAQPLDDIRGLVHQKFTGAGFKEISSDSYARNTETCTVMHKLGKSWIEIRCAGEKLEQALAKQAEPFVDLYLKSHKDVVPSDLVYGPMVVRSQNPHGAISSSKIVGYDLAEAVIQDGDGSSIALYYSHQGAWHYITEAGDEFGFSCRDIMKDVNARRAYRHQWCYMRENDEGLRLLDSHVQ